MSTQLDDTYNTNFVERLCKRCNKIVTPVVDGKIDPQHGYLLRCPFCRSSTWWGGKKKNIKDENGVRRFVSRYTPGGLSINYCQICHRAPEMLGKNETLHVHHLIDVNDGGEDSIANIIVVCTACHRLIMFAQTYLNKHFLNEADGEVG